MNIKTILAFVSIIMIFSATGSYSGPSEPDSGIAISTIKENNKYLGARATGIIDASPSMVWGMITDYPASPQFMPHVKKSEIVRKDGNRIWVKNIMSFLVFNVKFTCEMIEERNTLRVSWNQSEGPFKFNRGSWEIRPYGDKVMLTYFVEFEHPLLPNWARESLITKSIPTLFKAIRDRAEFLKKNNRVIGNNRDGSEVQAAN